MIDVADWQIAGEEPQGRRRHPWVRRQGFERTWLFKETFDEPDRPLDEGMTEKLASELASKLRVPAARVELASLNGRSGCLVEDVRWSKGSDQPGQVLLSGSVPDYDPEDTEHRGYNTANIRSALATFAVPPDAEVPEGFTGFDVFAGYLIFDALIANGDRHDRNWAVMSPPPGTPGPDRLCSSYDHASSLGFNLSDEERLRRLSSGTVAQWARRGWARQFERRRGAPRQSLVRLAEMAIDLCDEAVRKHWYTAILSVGSDQLGAVLASAPGLTAVTKDFTLEVLMVNRERLLDVLS